MRFVVTEAHRGPVHAPLSLKKGDLVSVGEPYKGPESWPDWVWCVTGENAGGWIPLQILERHEDGTAVALEDYSSSELDADEGDAVTGTRETNGWLWCVRARDGVSGWVPRDKLRADREP